MALGVVIGATMPDGFKQLFGMEVRRVGLDEEADVGDYAVTAEFTEHAEQFARVVLRGEVVGFHRARGAPALLAEALSVLRVPGGASLCE